MNAATVCQVRHRWLRGKIILRISPLYPRPQRLRSRTTPRSRSSCSPRTRTCPSQNLRLLRLAPECRYYIPPEPNQDRNLGTQINKKVDIYLLMKNTEENGMGMPLPAGRIRVYKKRRSGQIPRIHRRGHHPAHAERRRGTGQAWQRIRHRRRAQANRFQRQLQRARDHRELRNQAPQSQERSRRRSSSRRTCSAGRTGRSRKSATSMKSRIRERFIFP